MRQLTSEQFKMIDPLAVNGGQNPYREGDPTLLNMFRLGPDFYRKYIQEKTRFTNGARVLDLLCGFGLWTMFLAEVNGEVIGIDKAPGCKPYGEALAKLLEVDNTKFITGDVSETRRFANGYFDYVWMYSALQYVHRGEVLAEVSRVLKRGGRFFSGNYNSTGLMIDHFMKGVETNTINQGSSQWALNALVHGPLWDGNPSYGTPDTIGDVCSKFGLKLIAAAPQGGMNLSLPGGLVPNFKGVMRYGHYAIVIDFVAEKV